MVEATTVVGGSGTSVGMVIEQRREHIPEEGSSKSGAVMLMPWTVSTVCHKRVNYVPNSLTSSTNTEYLRY